MMQMKQAGEPVNVTQGLKNMLYNMEKKDVDSYFTDQAPAQEGGDANPQLPEVDQLAPQEPAPVANTFAPGDLTGI